MKFSKSIKSTVAISVALSTIFVLTSCGRHGVRLGHILPRIPLPIVPIGIPTPHAVVPGPRAISRAIKRKHRVRHHYRYYPSASVYFDTDSNMYHYYSRGAWIAAAALPRSILINLGNPVNIEMDSAKPYSRHKHHKRQYPAGSGKKKHGGRGNNHRSHD